MKSILFILALGGTTKRRELEYVHDKLADMHKTLNIMMQNPLHRKYGMMPALEAIEEAEKDDFDLRQIHKPISFIRLVEYLNGAPILSTTIMDLKSKSLFDTTLNVMCRDISDDLGALHMAGLITKPSKDSFGWSDPEISLTAQGEDAVERIASGKTLILRSPDPSQRRVFMACSFGREDVDNLCESVIEPICLKLKAHYCRIDTAEPSTTITDEILNSIRRCSAIVVDLTYARPSVYFEAGFALSLGVPILLTCRRDHYRGAEDYQRVHFDLEQFKVSFWERKKQGQFSWAKGMEPAERLGQLLGRRTNALKREMQDTQQKLEATLDRAPQ